MTNRDWRNFNHSHFKPNILGGIGLQPCTPPNVPFTEEQLERGAQRLLAALRNCKCESEEQSCQWCTGEILETE